MFTVGIKIYADMRVIHLSTRFPQMTNSSSKTGTIHQASAGAQTFWSNFTGKTWDGLDAGTLYLVPKMGPVLEFFNFFSNIQQ